MDRNRDLGPRHLGTGGVTLILGRVAATAATLLFLIVPSPALAAEATAAEVRRLAGDAVFDDEVLARLREVDEIDGRPADLDRVLEGASGEEIERRVGTLLDMTGDAGSASDAAASRAEAARILEQDRYRPDDIPRPFRGPLEWIADRLEPVGDAIDSAYGWVADIFSAMAQGVPGGAATLWTIFGMAIIAVVVRQTKHVVDRRTRARSRDREDHAALRGDDPRDLERRAAAARARGDHELAVRLLFRAGLLRLARARVIPARDSLTTGDIRRLLDSPQFDRLGASFDEIAYGRRAATDADSRSARETWSELLQTRPG